jgi:hypothetical protein
MDRYLMWMQCSACLAIFQTVQPDGTRYFHVCAPVIDKVTLVQTALPNARNENAPTPAALAALLAANVPAGGDNYHAPRNAYSDGAMVSAGAGVVVADPALVAKLTKPGP